jgi:hypothetical protein
MKMNPTVSLLNIKEDLLDDKAHGFEVVQNTQKGTPSTMHGKIKPAKNNGVNTELNTFEKLLAPAIKKLNCTSEELAAWLKQIPNTPEKVQQNALRLIGKYELDPFVDEIAIHQYEDANWQVFITVDGWSKLINSHPAFSGISFTQADELLGGVPAWMGCAIYRNDRVVPVEVKEYLCEIQTEHSIWKEMPRRMLRHRVIAQCARLAFGVSVPEIQASKSVKKLGETIGLQENINKTRAQILKESLIR